MKRHMPICCLAVCLMVTTLQAQETRPFRQFATQQVHKQLLEQYPDFSATLEGQENFIRDYGTTGDDRPDQIAVVFHVLYTDGTPYPGLEHLNAAVEALNRDFGKYVPPATPYESVKFQEFEALAKDPLISFCMPLSLGGTEPDGAVRFVETSVAEWEPGDAMKSGLTDGDDPLDTKQYLNIWVCELKGNAAGHAQLPGGPGATDGIVIDYDYLPGYAKEDGYPYKDGKTLTHLVGSYLGLYELWNEENPCADDGVEDTPIHNAPNYIIPEPGVRHIALCGEGPVDEMVMNFMDNTDDSGQNLFTAGQKARMKAILSPEGPRQGLAAAPTLCSGGLNGGQAGQKVRPTAKGAGNSRLQLFPNPTMGDITLRLRADSPSATLVIYNDQGKAMMNTVCSLEGGRQTLKLDCGGWPPGLYMVAVSLSDGDRMSTVFSIAR